MNTIDARTLKDWLHDGAELAILDVREHGQFGQSHLFCATPLPYSRLELDIGRLVPRRSTRVVLCDDGVFHVAERAEQRLAELGYTCLHVLAGGTKAWEAAGFRLFAGVNVPSKAFGELIEHICHTPKVTASQLAAMQAEGRDLVILDGRPVSEYRQMNIPGSICCPNGELVYRFGEIVGRPQTTVVINCAGRTRSIIGAQTLINFGVPNRVFALENGTQGWYLCDLPLEHGSSRRYPAIHAGADLGSKQDAAARMAKRCGVSWVDGETVSAWCADQNRTLYLCDIRTSEEFAQGSLAGALHTPGGQLLQATDQWIGVRNARLVIIDGEGIRAPVVASWLKQMGHDAYVLEHGIHTVIRSPEPLAERNSKILTERSSGELPVLSAAELRVRMAARSCQVIDLRPSMVFRKAHIAGSIWSTRSVLHRTRASKRTAMVLVADDKEYAALAARELRELGIVDISLFDGGSESWRVADLPIESSPDDPPDAECIDYLFFVHDRHAGNKAAARQYLAWELSLLDQIDSRERASFRIEQLRGASDPS